MLTFLFIQGSKPQTIIRVDFSSQTGTGSPLMFGGNNYGFSSAAISMKHKQAGFNIARYDALMNEIIPASTINNYKANVNDVQNPEKWNWQRIDNDLNMLHESGFKVLLIVNYCPLWLETDEQTKLNKNSINAVPSDWMVYEDIVKKVFQHIQNKIYAIEVWNEPDLGLSIDGTPYKTRLSAYLDLYVHTANAIRIIDKTIKIGGPAAGNTYETDYLDALLTDNRANKNFDFYSYHFYGEQKPGNITTFKKIAASHGRPNLPIVISEWNYSANFDKNPMNTNSVDAISFVGNTLIDQFKEAPYISILYCMDDYRKADNFYTMDINGNLVPKVSAIRLISVKLRLGLGDSKIYKSISSSDINTLAAKNYADNAVVCMVNTGNSIIKSSIAISGLKINGNKPVDIFEAS
ncbi:MAG: GH39 family glycosyl hydrolase, partial [Mucilaginibacter sp.]